MSRYDNQQKFPLAGIDWQKLAGCYRALRWRWGDVGIPSAEQLKAHAVYYAAILPTNSPYIGSGGIIAWEGGLISFDKRIEALYLPKELGVKL